MTICERFDVVAVPFPFSDIPRVKRRKALVLSARPFNLRNGSSLLMMITSAAHRKWFLDVNLEEWREAGLQKPCVARMKLFTLDNRLILSRTGSLSAADRRSVVAALREALPQHA
jgi:mRNA interferase MazF